MKDSKKSETSRTARNLLVIEERGLKAEGRAACKAMRQHSESSQQVDLAGALNEWKRKAGSKVDWGRTLYKRVCILELMVRAREKMKGVEMFLMEGRLKSDPS